MPERHSTDAAQTAVAGALGRIGRYRWTICALIFFCTTINYIDRNSLSVLKTTLQSQLGWTDVDYGWITFAFTAAYAAFPSIIGTLIDRFGVKRSLSGALILWSLMAAAHGLVRTVLGFAIVRFLLGFAEAANFPASIKAIAMWFPQKERALATGLFNSGTNVGVMVSFATVWLATTFGWQWAFVTDRRHRVRLAVLLALGLRRAAAVGQGRSRRARLHPGRPAEGTGEAADSLDGPPALPADLAVPRRQADHRPRLVVLPVLAAVVSRTGARAEPDEERPPARRHLHRRERRLDGRRLAVGLPDVPGLEGRPGAALHDAHPRVRDAVRDPRLLHRQLCPLRGVDLDGHRIAPVVVRQHLHDGDRSVPHEGLGGRGRPRMP